MKKFDSRSSGYAGLLQVPKVTKMLLTILVAVFLFGVLFKTDSLLQLGMFTPDLAIFSGQVWRFITCSFVHLDGAALLSSFCLLFFFTKNVEPMIGSRRYLLLFLLGGIASPIFYSVLILTQLVPATDGAIMAGAMSGCFALLTALYIMAGDMMVQLFFIAKPFKQRWVLVGLAAFWCLSLLANKSGTVPAVEASPIVGVLVGWLLMKYAYDAAWFSGVRGRTQKVKLTKKAKYEAKMRPRKPANIRDTEVDKILDKISANGFQSLTDKERKILEKASNKDE